jgi:hypothetical protein
LRGLAFCWALVALTGCYVSPVAPHPSIKYVAHPMQADASLSLEELQERYSASPDQDPDDLGAIDYIWLQSYLTLVVPALALKLQERAQVAYSRTDEEQERALQNDEAYTGRSVVFSGMLIGDFAELLDLEDYKPEGIFLLDDKGRKFYPWLAHNMDPSLPPVGVSEFGAAHWSYPLLQFPGDAIGPDTRAVSVYLATPAKRIRFTWVFDPAYELPDVRDRPDAERKRRLFQRVQ